MKNWLPQLSSASGHFIIFGSGSPTNLGKSSLQDQSGSIKIIILTEKTSHSWLTFVTQKLLCLTSLLQRRNHVGYVSINQRFHCVVTISDFANMSR